jgi:hypothetical protein
LHDCEVVTTRTMTGSLGASSRIVWSSSWLWSEARMAVVFIVGTVTV